MLIVQRYLQEIKIIFTLTDDLSVYKRDDGTYTASKNKSHEHEAGQNQ
jgi:hypothetical protein